MRLSRKQASLLLANWVTINFLPFLLISQFSGYLWWRHHERSEGYIALFYVDQVFFVVLEALAWLLMFSWIKWISYGKKVARVLLSVTANSIVAAYYVIILTSWKLFETRGEFVTKESLRLAYFLSDLTNMLNALSPADLVLSLGQVVLACSISFVMYAVAPSWDLAQAKRLFVASIGSVLILLGVFGVIPIRTMAEEDFLHLRPIARHFLSPQWSLVWSDLLFGGEGQEFYPVKLSLTSRYTNEEYIRRFDLQGTKPNVLIFVVEALRSDVIFHEHQRKAITPQINRFAQQGHYFSHAYAQSPETGYSLLSILTGTYPLRRPYRDLNFDLNYPFVRMYDLLKLLGYRTALLGPEWILSKRATDSPHLDLHFDPQLVPVEERRRITEKRRLNVEAGLRALSSVGDIMTAETFKNWVIQEETKPFFALLYFYASHFPYPPPEQGEAVFAPNEVREQVSFLGYDQSLVPVMKNRYYNTLHYVDSLIGEIFSFLSARGDLGRTIVVITGDHGQLFHEHGSVAHSGPLHEEAIRVPLIFAGLDLGRGTHDSPVGLVDIAPTILELLGLPPHANFQGRAILFRNASGRENVGTRPIFSTVQVLTFEDAVILWPYKYVINHRGREDRMFHLATDPGELRNLVALRRDLAPFLRSRLLEFRNKQLYYYSDESPYKSQYFPPQYDLPDQSLLRRDLR